MKVSEQDYQEIKKSIEAKGVEKIKAFKEQLKKAQAEGKTFISDFDTRLIFDVYYSSVPLDTRMKIMDNGDYKDTHIKTATKKALLELGIL